MNQPSLRDEFERLARRRPIRPTNVQLVVSTAKARSRRRRVSAAVGGAAALTTVTVVGIDSLSTTDSLQGTSDSIAPGSVTTLAGGPDATAAPPLPAPAPTIAPPEVFVPDNAVPATRSDPVMTWTVVEADSPQALAFRYGGSDQRYALATEASAGPDFGRRALYEQVDGEWQQVASDVLPDGLRQATISGDTIYAVGTEPATAGAEPGAVGAYDIAAGSWNLMPLPDEAHAYRGDAVQVGVEMSITPLDDGALVAFSRYEAAVDHRRLADTAGADLYQWWPVEGGVEVATNCDAAAIEREMNPLYESSPTSAEIDAANRQAIAEHCTVQVLTVDDLELDGEDLAHFGQPARATLWRFDGSTLTPIDLPDPVATSVHVGGGVLTTSSQEGGARAWLVAPDGSFTEAFAEVFPFAGGSVQPVDGGAVLGTAGTIGRADAGGATTYVDLAPVVTDDTMVDPRMWINSVAATGDATVAIANVEYRLPGVLTEQTTISDTASGFDLVIDPGMGVTVVQQSTGMVAVGGYTLATESGSVQLVAADGQSLALAPASSGGTLPPVPVATTAPFDLGEGGGATTLPGSWPSGVSTLPTEEGQVLATFAVDPATIPRWAQRYEERIVSTVDGQAYASESFRDLLRLTDEWASAFGVRAVDGRFVVSVQVSRNDTEPRTVYLVGTPTT